MLLSKIKSCSKQKWRRENKNFLAYDQEGEVFIIVSPPLSSVLEEDIVQVSQWLKALGEKKCPQVKNWKPWGGRQHLEAIILQWVDPYTTHPSASKVIIWLVVFVTAYEQERKGEGRKPMFLLSCLCSITNFDWRKLSSSHHESSEALSFTISLTTQS